MASTLGGNKAGSVQERIKQLIEQGVPLTEATDQAHREAVAATELMFPTTEGDRPPPGVTTAATFGDAPLSGVTTAATFGDGSTGISARPSPYFQLGEKIDVQSHSDWIKARRQALDELNRKYDASAEQSPSQTAPVDDSSDRLEGVSAEAKQEILEAGGEVTPSVDVEERPTDPIRAGDPPEDAEREFAGAGISDPTLALDDFYPEMTDVDQQALVRALLSEGQQPTGIALPEQAGGQRIPRLLELLGGIGGQIAQSRAIGSSNRANAARQARANLQSALRGGGGGAAFQETPKVGLLGHLATGLKGLGTGLQDVRTDEVAAEQADFENRIKQRELDLKAQGRDADLIRAEASRLRALRPSAGKLPTAGQNKLAMMELGRDLHDDGLTREGVREAVQQDPDYQALVTQNPNIAAEMIGNALRGFDAREQGVFDREIDIANEERARAREDRGVAGEERKVVAFTQEQADTLVRSYTRRLEGAVSAASTAAGSEIEDPREFFKKYKLQDMVASGSDLLVLDLESAYLQKVGEYAAARVAFHAKEREEARKIQAVTLANAKHDFGIQDTLRKSVMALPGVKSFSGAQGLGPSFARMQGFYNDYRSGKTEAGRAEAQVAMVNQFQRLIDPATVRSQDIELYRDALSTMANIEIAFVRIGKGGFLPDDMIDGMMRVATSLHTAQREFVETEVESAIGVWDAIHPKFAMGDDAAKKISRNILGGNRTESDAERIERLEKERVNR